MTKSLNSAAFAAFAALALVGTPSHAILIDGDGPQFQTRPTDPEEANLWDHFCYSTNSSGGAVYIGNVGSEFPRGMMISARHLGAFTTAIWQCMNGAQTFTADVVNGQVIDIHPCFWTSGTEDQPPTCELFEPSPETGSNPNGTGDIEIFSPATDPWALGDPATRNLSIRTAPPNTPDEITLIGNDEAFQIGSGRVALELLPPNPNLPCHFSESCSTHAAVFSET
jgi:hypothetical protein